MGIAERKEKQKTELKQLILEASIKLFSEKGYDGFSMRKLAELIEYSPTTVYLYYRDKNEILFELHEVGFTKYAEANANLNGIKNPLLRLHKMGENYIRFGLEYPEYYDLMFLLPAPMEYLNNESQDLCWDGGDRALKQLVDVLDECMEKKLIYPGDVHAMAMAIWSLVHGMVSLYIRKRYDKLIAEEQIIPAMHNALNWMVSAVDTSR